MDNETKFTVVHRIMTNAGAKVMITWSAYDENYMVLGENMTEALRSVAQMEEDRVNKSRGY